MPALLTAIVVHPDGAIRGRLGRALDATAHVELVGEYAELGSGLAHAHALGPAILVLGAARAGDRTWVASAAFAAEHPECAVLVHAEAANPEAIRRALGAGVRDVLRSSSDVLALARAVEHVRAARAALGPTARGRGVFSVFSNKGGTGVTTLAANLAIGLRRATQRSIVLADLDIGAGGAAFALGLTPSRSMADVLVARRIDAASIRSGLVRHASGLDILALPERLDRIEGVNAQQLGTVTGILAMTHDTVVIDAPHAFDDRTLELLDRSGVIVLVTEPNVATLRATRRALETLARFNLTSADRVRLVANRWVEPGAWSVERLEDAVGHSLFARIAKDDVAVERAANLGRPIADAAPGSPADRDIAALVARLAPDLTERPASHRHGARSPERFRLFKRW